MGTVIVVFLWCLSTSIMASVIALIVVSAKIILKDRISVRVYCILWFLVLIRLVIPFAPESSISIFNLLHYEEANKVINTNLISMLSIIWISGAAILIIVLIYFYILFLRKSRHFLQVNDIETLSILTSCKLELGIKISIPIYLAPSIGSPCITGVVRPRIFIPENIYKLMNHQQLRYVLMHELAHYKKKDVLLNHVITALNIVHWFNPVIWYAFIQMNRDREIACDTYVLKTLEQDEYIPYAMTLLIMTRFLSKNKQKISFVNFFKTKKQIEKRIDIIKLFRRGTQEISAVALICCLIVGAMTLTNATSFKEKAFTQSGGDVSNIVLENRGDLPGTVRFSENLDDWLRFDLIPFLEGNVMKYNFYYLTSDGKVEKYR